MAFVIFEVSAKLWRLLDVGSADEPLGSEQRPDLRNENESSPRQLGGVHGVVALFATRSERCFEFKASRVCPCRFELPILAAEVELKVG